MKRKSLSKQRARARAADTASNPALSHVGSPSASALSEGVDYEVEVQGQAVENHSQSGVSLDQIKELLGSFSRSFEEKFQPMSSCIDSLTQDVTNVNNQSF